MKKDLPRICPRCSLVYHGYSALSGADNKTEICQTCGITESLEVAALAGKGASREDIRKLLMDRLCSNPIESISAEQMRQLKKWGVQRHTWPQWMSVLAEEVGEAAQEVNKTFESGHSTLLESQHRVKLRRELIQVAAVAVTWVEQLDEETSKENNSCPGKSDEH